MFGGQLQRLPLRNSSLIYDVLWNTLDVGRCLYLVSAMSLNQQCHDMCCFIFQNVNIFFIPCMRIYLVLLYLKPSSTHTLCVRTGLDLIRLRGCADSPHSRVVAFVIMASFVLSGSIPNLISDET